MQRLRAPLLAILTIGAAATVGRPALAFSGLAAVPTAIARTGWREQSRGSDQRLAPALREDAAYPQYDVGQELWGRVEAIKKSRFGAADVDIGRGRAALLLPEDMACQVKRGQDLKLWVRKIEPRTGRLLLTTRRSVLNLRVGERLNGTVTRVDKDVGGIFVDVGAGRDGLMLRKQLTKEFKKSLSGPLQPGVKVWAWVKEVKSNGRFMLTMRMPRTPLKDLRVGQHILGIVKALQESGIARVDVGAQEDGRLLLRELSSGPPTALEVGSAVDVWIKRITKDRRVYVTAREPTLHADDIEVGMKLKGTVFNIPEFGGAFIDVGAVREALLKQGDVPGERPLEVGQDVEVWLETKDADLTMQVTMIKPTVLWSQLKVGREVQGPLVSRDSSGVFLDIGWVRPAWLPFDQMTTELLKSSETMPMGHRISARIRALLENIRGVVLTVVDQQE